MTTQTVLFIVIAGIVAAGLALWQYYLGKRHPKWRLLAGLRFVTYFAVFLLLINPKFSQRHYSLEKPTLVLAVDNSQSISLFDQAETVRNSVHRLTSNQNLADRFTIKTYSFGAHFRKTDSFSFEEKQTNISAALAQIQDLYETQTAPTVLITDGNQTFGRDYVFQAKRFTQPLYPVVVGDTTSYADLKIQRLNVNRYSFLHNKFPVEIFVNYQGQSPVTQELTITQNGRVLFRKSLSFTATENAAIIKAKIEAKRVGVQAYKVKVASLDGEKNTANNQRKFAVEVIDQTTNVLLLSAFPHPDIGALKKAIEHNKQRRTTIQYIGDDDIDFGAYQLVVFYQPNKEFKNAFETAKRLGMNTFIITGTATDYSFLNQYQEFFTKKVGGETENYLPVYNANFSQFQFQNIGFDDFPPLVDKFGELQFSSAVHPLLFQSIKGYQLKAPLLATAKHNQRQFGFLFGENIWQWRAKSYRDHESFKPFDEFFGRLIQYLASNKHRNRLTVDFNSFYNTGEAIVFRAHYFDANYRFDPAANIWIELKNSETKQTQRLPFILKEGYYELDLDGIKPGKYKFIVHVKDEKFTREGEFTIIDFNVEEQFLSADASKLRKITAAPLYSSSSIPALIQSLLDNPDYKPVQRSNVTRSPLIDWWYLLFIIMASLSTEWFLRKYKGLV